MVMVGRMKEKDKHDLWKGRAVVVTAAVEVSEVDGYD